MEKDQLEKRKLSSQIQVLRKLNTKPDTQKG